MKAADITDVEFLSALKPLGGGRTLTRDLATRWPDYSPKVVLTTARRLLKRGLIDGCACGCRGDFELTQSGADVLSEAGDNPEATR